MNYVSWLNPAGGVGYHLRAWRYSTKQWGDFRTSLAGWLSLWQPKADSLVLVGSSAGYCLEFEFLKRFKKIVAIDPDPLARALFYTRHGRKLSLVGTTLRWDHTDYFHDYAGRLSGDALTVFFSKYRDHAVLFCNVLGQLHCLHDEKSFETQLADWRMALQKNLESSEWASFHDRLSGSVVPTVDSRVFFPQALSNDELVRTFYQSTSTLATHSNQIELTDHLTESLVLGNSYTYFSWALAPGAIHLIEAVHS